MLVNQAASARSIFLAAEQNFISGRLADAERLGREALAIDPGHAGSLNLLGLIALAAGDASSAIRTLIQAISAAPTVADYRRNLGRAQLSQGDTDAAIISYQAAIALAPQCPLHYIELAGILGGKERRSEAIACMREAVELVPDDAGLQYSLGVLSWQQGDATTAASCLRSAIALQPDLVQAYTGLGYIHQMLGETTEAIALLRRALAFEPAPSLLSLTCEVLGIALMEENLPDEACALFRRCVRINPNSAALQCNLGNALARQMRLSEAAAAYRSAIALDPSHADARLGLGMTLLSLGDWTTGGRDYEQRQSPGGYAAWAAHAGVARWRGEPAAGKTLFIALEGGFGDTLNFCRYATVAAQNGLKVVLAAQPELTRLLHHLPGVDAIAPVGSVLPPFDLYCPMFSLPFNLGATPANIPYAEGYLRPEAQDVAKWRNRLAARPNGGIRIGLVWSGSPRPDIQCLSQMDRRRSLSPERLEPLFDIPGLEFFTLQKGGQRAPRHFPLTDYTEELHDFADTAALIASLDLVISVDTSVGHLAGALGKPVWLLNRFDSCWRWLADRDDTPWYHSMRLYRQPYPGCWDVVLSRVADDLRRVSEARGAAGAVDGTAGR